jgi:hypothetical protein
MHFREAGVLDAASPDSDGEYCDQITFNPGVGVMAGRHGRGNILPWAMPLDQRIDEAYSLVYSTPPLTEDLELAGVPVAVLFVASSADVAYFHVKLCDIAPDGTSKWVIDGGLNATHRNSHSQPEPIVPGQVYELKFDLKHVAYRFEAGHRMRVCVACADFQNAWPTSKNAVNTIYRNRAFPSQVILPIVPKRNPLLPEPRLEPSPHAAPKLESISKPEHRVTHDLVNQTITSSFGTLPTSPPSGINRSSFTVSLVNPAEAVIDSDCEYVVSRAGSEFKLYAHCVTMSTEATYRHFVDLDIKLNGKPHVHKSWQVLVPRRLD